MRMPTRRSVVYLMTNGDVMNEVVAFCRDVNGRLAYMGSYPTYGKGTGPREVSAATANDGVDPLASQGALKLSRDGRFLFAVNAGSNSISSFLVADSGKPVIADVKPSGGAQPNSLDMYGDLLYVSNVGDPANRYSSNLSGFRVDDKGLLAPIPGAVHPLSTINAQPSQVVFTPDGGKIVVSELTTNRLSVFKVNANGTVTGPIMNDSSGSEPFGSLFLSSGVLLVAEAGSNALSSYAMSKDGILHPISGSVPNGQKATCWVAATKDERFVYASNTLSGTISTYRIDNGGGLTLAGQIASTPAGEPTGLPVDIGVSGDGRHFYALNGNRGTVSAFKINDDGSLAGIQVAAWTGLPYFGSQGLAVL